MRTPTEQELNGYLQAYGFIYAELAKTPKCGIAAKKVKSMTMHEIMRVNILRNSTSNPRTGMEVDRPSKRSLHAPLLSELSLNTKIWIWTICAVVSLVSVDLFLRIIP